MDLLKCSACKAILYGKLASGADPDVYKRSTDAFREKLMTQHNKFCTWGSLPSPEGFADPQTGSSPPEVFLDQIRGQIKLGGDRLPRFTARTLSRLLPQDVLEWIAGKLGYASADAQDRDPFHSAVLLSLFGWDLTGSASVPLISCTTCQRKCGVWMYHAIKDPLPAHIKEIFPDESETLMEETLEELVQHELTHVAQDAMDEEAALLAQEKEAAEALAREEAEKALALEKEAAEALAREEAEKALALEKEAAEALAREEAEKARILEETEAAEALARETAEQKAAVEEDPEMPVANESHNARYHTNTEGEQLEYPPEPPGSSDSEVEGEDAESLPSNDGEKARESKSAECSSVVSDEVRCDATTEEDEGPEAADVHDGDPLSQASPESVTDINSSKSIVHKSGETEESSSQKDSAELQELSGTGVVSSEGKDTQITEVEQTENKLKASGDASEEESDSDDINMEVDLSNKSVEVEGERQTEKEKVKDPFPKATAERNEDDEKEAASNNASAIVDHKGRSAELKQELPISKFPINFFKNILENPALLAEQSQSASRKDDDPSSTDQSRASESQKEVEVDTPENGKTAMDERQGEKKPEALEPKSNPESVDEKSSSPAHITDFKAQPLKTGEDDSVDTPIQCEPVECENEVESQGDEEDMQNDDEDSEQEEEEIVIEDEEEMEQEEGVIGDSEEGEDEDMDSADEAEESVNGEEDDGESEVESDADDVNNEYKMAASVPAPPAEDSDSDVIEILSSDEEEAAQAPVEVSREYPESGSELEVSHDEGESSAGDVSSDEDRIENLDGNIDLDVVMSSGSQKQTATTTTAIAQTGGSSSNNNNLPECIDLSSDNGDNGSIEIIEEFPNCDGAFDLESKSPNPFFDPIKQHLPWCSWVRKLSYDSGKEGWMCLIDLIRKVIETEKDLEKEKENNDNEGDDSTNEGRRPSLSPKQSLDKVRSLMDAW